MHCVKDTQRAAWGPEAGGKGWAPACGLDVHGLTQEPRRAGQPGPGQRSGLGWHRLLCPAASRRICSSVTAWVTPASPVQALRGPGGKEPGPGDDGTGSRQHRTGRAEFRRPGRPHSHQQEPPGHGPPAELQGLQAPRLFLTRRADGVPGIEAGWWSIPEDPRGVRVSVCLTRF